MDGPTGIDRDCLLHEPRLIYRFADLKSVLFLKGPLHSIPAVINACAVHVPNENIATDSCLSFSRPLT